MPFQSEKQRRYLWANEPEIARDWTDTYGSRIQKNDGGIMRLGFKKGSDRGGHDKTAAAGKSYEAAKEIGGEKAWQERALQTHRTEQQTQGKGAEQRAAEERAKQYKASARGKWEIKKTAARNKKLAQIRNIKPTMGHWLPKGAYGLTPKTPYGYQYLESIKNDPTKWDLWNSLPQELKDLVEDQDLSGISLDKWKDLDKIPYDQYNMLTQVPGYGEFLEGIGKPGVKHAGNVGGLGERFVLRDEDGDPIEDEFGNTKYGYHDKPGGEGPIYYPGYVPGGSPQGGGGTSVTEVVEDTPSAFQASLTTGASSPFDYYVGTDPTAANLAWGEKFNVDPRTMGLTSWADGGRIPAAYGGIMDSSTGRRAYGLGSIFSKIGRAAKKVLGSDVGKAALIAGGFGLAGMGPFKGLQGTGFGQTLGGWFGEEGALAGLVRKKLKDDTYGDLSLAKLGIWGASALPFFMGDDDDDDDDERFDYDAAKNKYRDELMRIKAGAMAGTLDPARFRYLGIKDGGRIGLSNGGDPLLREEYDKYVFEMKEMGLTPMSFEEFIAQARAGMYAGGQSIPSEYTMEDAMMTTTQDKLGGITDVMKQADLNRKGSVGQYYAAQGGRIGYDAGGQTGHPPITTGQVPPAPPQMPAAPPQRPNPMPAPQPNRMAGMPGGMNPRMRGMNPMMNRPMMRGNPMMGGRMMAQEGGLMDLGGMEKDYRNDGGFVPLGGEEKADDVPARLSKNEFVFTADAVRGAGDGDIDKGAEVMENIMKNLEQGGQISEETQGLSGAQEMFGVSERLSEVV